MMSRRSPNPSSRSSSKQPPQQKTPAELVTYRLDNEMVYVQPTSDFEHSTTHKAFFHNLQHVARERIAFSVNVRVGSMLRTVRIAPMAWGRVLHSLATYEIVDLSILPLASTSRAAKSETDIITSAPGITEDAPPQYGYSGSGPGLSFGDSKDSNLLGADLRDSDRSPQALLQQPASPVMKRCTSALGWFGKHR
ncbi:hypothetical protein DFH11DRAFT_1743049 [Phellopilus nigrolimitatus]|nr:hypothetical protein DFH11DRAFT_1743049 [Phellopilus nigrolimitatus]